MQNLLTSVLEGSLAFSSLAVLYFSLSLSNLVSAEVVVRFKPRTVMTVSAFGFTVWATTCTLAAHHIVPWTIYIGSVIAG